MEKRINLFVTEQGSILSIEGNRLFVKVNKETKAEIPLINIRQIVLFGNITITPIAITRILNEKIPISYLTKGGKFIGQIIPPVHSNSKILNMQVNRAQDNKFRLSFAKSIIDAKIKNSIFLLTRRYRNRTDLEDEIKSLKSIISNLQNAENLKEVLGYEGSSSRIYFSAFSKLINNEFEFSFRNKRPSEDPINSLLSLTYTLVHSICYSMLMIAGLNPNIGILHEEKFGHPALASDLLEEFRAFICDRFVIKLINQGYFNYDSFTYTEKGVFLKDEALKKYLKEWGAYLDNDINIDNSFETNIFRLFEIQANKLKRSILSGENYEPYIAMEKK